MVTKTKSLKESKIHRGDSRDQDKAPAMFDYFFCFLALNMSFCIMHACTLCLTYTEFPNDGGNPSEILFSSSLLNHDLFTSGC